MNIEALKAGIAKFHLTYGPEDCTADELVGYNLAAYSLGFDDNVNSRGQQLCEEECPAYMEGWKVAHAMPVLS